jgi:hypothetical protein
MIASRVWCRARKLCHILRRPDIRCFLTRHTVPAIELEPLLRSDVNTVTNVGANRRQFAVFPRGCYLQPSIHFRDGLATANHPMRSYGGDPAC